MEEKTKEVTTDYEVVEEVKKVEQVDKFELSVETLPVLVSNKEAFFKYLDTELEKYKGITLTEDSVKDGKATVAKLNNAKKAIDSKRISVKNEILKPYEEIEKVCREVKDRIDNVATPIKEQLDKFEADRIAQKREQIDTFTKEQLAGIDKPSVVNFIMNCEWVANTSWLNATYSMSKIKKEIQDAIAKILNDIEVLSKTLVDDNLKVIALGVYKETGDVSKTIQAYNELGIQAEESRKAIEEMNRADVTTDTDSEPVALPVGETLKPVEAKVYRYHFSVDMTEEQFNTMIDWFKLNDIHGSVRGKEIINAES